MGEATLAPGQPTRVGRLAARALLKLLAGLRAPAVERLALPYASLIEWPVDVGEPYLDLSEEELLVLVELAEEQEDPFVRPLLPCRAFRPARALRQQRQATTR
jgi:hypothetical protein